MSRSGMVRAIRSASASPFAGIRLGVLGDVERLPDRVLDCVRARIGRAGVAFAVPDIDGDAETTVVVEFDGFQFAFADADGQSGRVPHGDLGGAGAESMRRVEDLLDEGLEVCSRLVRIRSDRTGDALRTHSCPRP